MAKRIPRRFWSVLGIVAVILLAGFLVFTFLWGGLREEKSLGEKYIKAVQSHDFKAIGSLVDPAVQKQLEQGSKVSGQNFTTEFYQRYLGDVSDNKEIPSKGDIKSTGGSTGTSGNHKYAVVFYKVGNQKVSVVEVYGSDSKPFVLEARSGNDELSKQDFDKLYATHQKQLEFFTKALNTAEKPSKP